jgi:tetratricopeptide (TPR) repeat protein
MVKRLAAFVVGLVAIAGIVAPAYALGINEAKAKREKEAQLAGQRGDAALSDKKYDEAIEHYNKVLSANACGSDCGKYYFRRGLAWQGKQDCTKALEDYTKAQETVKDNGELYFNASLCHNQMNQPELALADLDNAIKVNPESNIYRVGRCIALFNKHDFAGALPDCEYTLGSAPDDQNMLYAAAMSAEQTGDKAKAAKFYKHLHDLNPGDARAADGLKRTGG